MSYQVLRQKQQLLARLPFLFFRERLSNRRVHRRIELEIVGVHRFNEIVHRAGAKVDVDFFETNILCRGLYGGHRTRRLIGYW